MPENDTHTQNENENENDSMNWNGNAQTLAVHSAYEKRMGPRQRKKNIFENCENKAINSKWFISNETVIGAYKLDIIVRVQNIDHYASNVTFSIARHHRDKQKKKKKAGTTKHFIIYISKL